MLEIRRAKIDDIPWVSVLERQIEKENATSEQTIFERYCAFPDGFLIAESATGIAGYLESCRWNLDLSNLEEFKQISNFPKMHKKDGENLYVIFVAVDKKRRREGIGSKLVQQICDYSKENGIKEVQLVAGENLKRFYEKLGFNFDRELSRFLPYSTGSLMRK